MKEYLLQYRKAHICLCNGISSTLQQYIITVNELSSFFRKGLYQEMPPLTWNRTKLCIKQLPTTYVVQKYHLMQKTCQSTVWQSLIKLTKRSGRNQLLRNVMFARHVDLHALLRSDCPSPRSIRYSYRNCASGKRWSSPRYAGA